MTQSPYADYSADDYLTEAEYLAGKLRELDRQRASMVIQRANLLQAGLDAGLTSAELSARLGVSSSRVFAMVRQGDHHTAKRA